LQAVDALRRRFDATALSGRGSGFVGATWRVALVVLARSLRVHGVTAIACPLTIAENHGASPSSASLLCGRLAAPGLVAREKNNCVDRTIVTFSLTGDGQQLLNRLAGEGLSAFREVLTGKAEADRDALVRGLQRFRCDQPTADAGALAGYDEPRTLVIARRQRAFRAVRHGRNPGDPSRR
jgi:DNA-binding MarR family transcriptional regulator